MKKLIVIILSIVALGASGTAMANNAPVAYPKNPAAETNTRGSLTSEVVNDIAVPTDVLIKVQTQYQGYAVTQASKITRDGRQAYRLRVDRDDVANDYESFYLLYDLSWNLLGEEKMIPPAPKPTSQHNHEDKKPAKPKRQR